MLGKGGTIELHLPSFVSWDQVLLGNLASCFNLPSSHYKFVHQAQAGSMVWCRHSIPEREEAKNGIDDQDVKVKRYQLADIGLSRNIQNWDFLLKVSACWDTAGMHS